MMTRREAMAAAGAAAAFVLKPAGAEPRVLKNMGVASTSFGARIRAGGGGRGGRGSGAPAAAPIMPPFDIMDYAHETGVGSVETMLTSYDADAIRKFRQRLDSYNLRLILSPRLPSEPSDVEAFDAAVRASKEAGAYSLHAAMTARRYEEFDTYEQYQQSFERCQKQIALAEPVLAKHKIRLGIENHKGWRAVEQAAWIERVSSEWVCVHLDFGNNISFCEDPMDTLKILLPYIISCHIKDQAVEPYADGFTLSEVPFGEGFLDLKGMVAALQKKDPNMPFDLEMMTREPLKVPVFTDKYWATFGDIPGKDLAHILEIVHKNKPKSPVPHVEGMSLEAQVKFEDENNRKCINWARQNLPV
ncbi:MAG TPA: sugar phosphate isomerase/epimerase family protein [Bryobacteraceae bacterium]|nr:sugar phosphate isomerase/epimerase family protein [Bryobacteraceae bacterium]